MKTISLNPKDLKQHWTRQTQPKPSQERVDGLSDEIARGTQLPAIYIVEPNLVVAGWARTLAHRAQQKDIPVIPVTEEAAAGIALGENANRLHYRFKYQLIWDSCELIERVVEHAEKTKLANLQNARQSESGLSSDVPENIDDCGNRLGVGHDLVFKCLKVHRDAIEWDKKHAPRAFGDSEKPLTAHEFITARVHDEADPCSPGQAWAGIAGSDAAKDGRTKPAPKQLELFTEGLKAIGKWGKSFLGFAGAHRKTAVDAIDKSVDAMPKELRAEFSAALKRKEREEREAQS